MSEDTMKLIIGLFFTVFGVANFVQAFYFAIEHRELRKTNFILSLIMCALAIIGYYLATNIGDT